MLKVTEMQIDPRSLGSKFWLTDVIPAYQYTNGQRTDTITGYRYSICLPEKGLEKINIRIEGKQLVEALESGYVEVTLSGIEVFLYWQNGAVQVGAKAVSYTHLDVYKRQRLRSLPKSGRSIAFSTCVTRSGTSAGCK